MKIIVASKSLVDNNETCQDAEIVVVDCPVFSACVDAAD